MPRPRVNIEGQKFGRLTALHDVGYKGRDRLWECLCECGQFTVVKVGQLKAGKVKSCGCLHSELASKRAKKDVAGHNKLPAGEANLNHVIRGYKGGAKKRNLEFSLTKEQFRELTQQKCFYCGTEPHNICHYPQSNGKFIYNGIDRIDNTKGYTVDNCITCCYICNQWKRAYTQQEFLMRIKLIYENVLRGRNA